jgi:hypothetical protein
MGGYTWFVMGYGKGSKNMSTAAMTHNSSVCDRIYDILISIYK